MEAVLLVEADPVDALDPVGVDHDLRAGRAGAAGVEQLIAVRQVEQLIRKIKRPPVVRTHAAPDPQREAIIQNLTEKLKAVLGTKVAINQLSKKKGRIEIEYYSAEEFERLLDLFRQIKTEEA